MRDTLPNIVDGINAADIAWRYAPSRGGFLAGSPNIVGIADTCCGRPGAVGTRRSNRIIDTPSRIPVGVQGFCRNASPSHRVPRLPKSAWLNPVKYRTLRSG